MSLADFDAAALELITEFGGTGTYIKGSQGSYNPATGSVVVTPTPIPVKAVVLDLTLQSNGLSTKYGTMVMAGDKEAYVIPPQQGPALTIDKVNDKFSMGGVTWNIETFKEINPTGTRPIVYFLYLRR